LENDLFGEIDRRIDWRAFYSQHLQKIKTINNDHINALCPFHSEKTGSFSVSIKNGTYHCFGCNEDGNALTFLQKSAGMTKDAALDHLKNAAGITNEKADKHPAARKQAKYTLEDYATEKFLPADALEGTFKAADKGLGIILPYMDESGAITATRQRYHGKKFSWTKGSKTSLYGLWLLDRARSKGFVILVEGESDTQTLVLHEFPALGVPGATTFQAEWVKYLEGLDVYLHNEGDAGGESFMRQTCERLASARFAGKVYEIQSIGGKDPNEMLKADVATFVQRWAEVMATARPLDIKAQAVKAMEAIPGQPVHLRIPPGWRVDERGIWVIDDNGRVLVCPVPVLLSKRLRSIETGEEKIEFVYLREGTWHRVITMRSVLFQARNIGILADKGLPVTSETARKLVKFLGELEAENLDLLDVAKAVDHLGWIDGKRFLPGLAEDVELDIDPSMSMLAGSYHQSGTMEGWTEAMVLQRSRQIPRLMLAASLAAPLLHLLNHRVFLVHSWGPSRGGKTAALKGALSVWGDPEGLVANFNATKVGLERLAAFYSDLPLGIDERQVVGDKQSFVESLVYLLGMGKGKTRGAKGGGLQNTKAWRTIVLTTGEEPLSNDSSATGVKTRVLELWGQPFNCEADARKMHGLSGQHFGHSGPDFVRRIQSQERNDPGRLRKDYDALAEYLQGEAPQAMGSHITALAVCCLADFYSSQWYFELDEPSAQAESLALASVTLAQMETAADTDYATRAMEWIESWISQNINKFKGHEVGEKYGELQLNEHRVWILPSAIEPALRAANFNPRRVWQDLKDSGNLEVEDGRSRKMVRMDGRSVRVIVLILDRNAEKDGFF